MRSHTLWFDVSYVQACRHYKTQIAAYDIRTRRCDTYGTGDGYSQQCFLVYDGLHYDALAVEAFADAPEEVDCTVLGVDDPDLPQVCAARCLAPLIDGRLSTYVEDANCLWRAPNAATGCTRQ